MPETDSLQPRKDGLQAALVFPLPGDHVREFPQLRQPQGPLQFHHPVIEADKTPPFQAPVGADMVVAVVVVLRGPAKEFGIVHDQHPALAGGQGLDRIEGKGADGPEGPQVLTPDKTAGGLGRIFQ